MPQFFVTWEETIVRGVRVDAASESEALAEGRRVVANGARGVYVEWVKDDHFEAEES